MRQLRFIWREIWDLVIDPVFAPCDWLGWAVSGVFWMMLWLRMNGWIGHPISKWWENWEKGPFIWFLQGLENHQEFANALRFLLQVLRHNIVGKRKDRCEETVKTKTKKELFCRMLYIFGSDFFLPLVPPFLTCEFEATSWERTSKKKKEKEKNPLSRTTFSPFVRIIVREIKSSRKLQSDQPRSPLLLMKSQDNWDFVLTTHGFPEEGGGNQYLFFSSSSSSLLLFSLLCPWWIDIKLGFLWAVAAIHVLAIPLPHEFENKSLVCCYYFAGNSGRVGQKVKFD